ncbi:hypothetical protein [Agromyces ramosus]|uniref:Lipoprotein n=1 Tax=Agromyces ramosus TaxID=33879 RepID=A0ABU0R9I9_9MICO|nr:hypothetical protein [Agromyces ramosus]MDQ0894749.1 hypothetical protein [Agromyces ramosus]
MSRIRPFVSMAAAFAVSVVAVLGLAGCEPPGEAVASEPKTAAPSVSLTPTPTPIETMPASVDPADVTTWLITTGGIGPFERGASYQEVIAGLPSFEVSEWCPWVAGLSAEGAGSMILTHPEGGEEIISAWVTGRADEAGTIPASPSTEAGIMLGSTMDELGAAYPDLQQVNQVGADSFGYAVGDDSNGYLDFIVEDGAVVLIGVQDVAGVPKEFCG